MQKLTSFFWLFPFIFFWLGYIVISHIMHIDQFPTPTLLGLQSNDAITLLSERQLNARILAHQETNDFPEGVILAQQPQPGQLVKPHQEVFVTLAKKQEKPHAPKLVGLPEKELISVAKNSSLKLKTFTLESIYPLGTCFAQFPTENTELATNTVIAYISCGLCAMRVLPDLKNKPATDVTQFFQDYGIKTQLFLPQPTPQATPPTGLIIDQKPIAGSLINLAKPLTIQLKTN